MSSLSYLGKKLQHLCSSIYLYMSCLCGSTCFLISSLYKSILFKVNKFVIQLFYFIFISIFGFLILRNLNLRHSEDFTSTNLDLFFTCVSSVTVSSMSTLEMEVFSNSQLIVITFLMFIGGEVFISMIELYLIRPKFKPWRKNSKIESILSSSSTSSPRNSNFNNDDDYNIELDIVVLPDSPKSNKSDKDDFVSSDNNLKYQSIKLLGVVTLVYLLVINIVGMSLVLVYLAFVSSAKDVLTNKGINTYIFAIFTTISSFVSCGFVPTNENMMVFSKNSGLLLIFIPQVLVGNALYPMCLRFSIRLMGKLFVSKKREAKYLLKNSREIGHLHLFSRQHSRLLVVTMFGFILVQFILFCVLEWNSNGLNGLNSYQRFVGSLFQVVNARHTGETIVDISTLSPPILVMFIVMMYLPPYTSFIPVKGVEENTEEYVFDEKQGRGKVVENFILSQLCYLSLFIILICITERKKIKDDPLNFNVFNITLEVVSAYGNVGFTTGYSCDRMINGDQTCKNKWYGFVGNWSDEGKIIIIILMFFGRLKKFNMQGGKPWKLL
ncbi:sodium transporter HKT1-like [Solanum stenotomum]|uniref:sodium transporter HKT1-like n=1 Tax=Solanum stenotomum TaxID=172797 RepID=UPI0020D08C06|nr:sodium transporter HKT1-like [Solanum stenotomum]